MPMDYRNILGDSLLGGAIISGIGLCTVTWFAVPAAKDAYRDSVVIDLIVSQVQMIHDALGVEARYRALTLADRLDYIQPYVTIAYMNSLRQRNIRFSRYIELAVKSKLIDILSR